MKVALIETFQGNGARVLWDSYFGDGRREGSSVEYSVMIDIPLAFIRQDADVIYQHAQTFRRSAIPHSCCAEVPGRA